jgi:hypothetical protein
MAVLLFSLHHPSPIPKQLTKSPNLQLNPITKAVPVLPSHHHRYPWLHDPNSSLCPNPHQFQSPTAKQHKHHKFITHSPRSHSPSIITNIILCPEIQGRRLLRAQPPSVTPSMPLNSHAQASSAKPSHA